MKKLIRFIVIVTAMCFLSIFPVLASEERTYPVVPYELPFGEPNYPYMDATPYCADSKIDNTLNVYFYVEDSNLALMKTVINICDALIWMPKESEGREIQRMEDDRNIPAYEYMGVTINPYNLEKVESLSTGGVYYMQFGIPDGYFTPTRGYTHSSKITLCILNSEFERATVSPFQYRDYYTPVPTSFEDTLWYKAVDNDLTLCALYGNEEWVEENYTAFQEWCKKYQEETGKLTCEALSFAEASQVYTPSQSLENVKSSEAFPPALGVKEVTESEENSSTEKEALTSITEKAQITIEMEEPEESEENNDKNITARNIGIGVMIIAAILLSVAIKKLRTYRTD